MKKIIVLFVLAVIGGYGAYRVLSAPEPDWTAIETPTFGHVFLVTDPTAPDVLVNLIFPSGEGANPFAEGLAHYVEHLAWLTAFSDSQPTQAARDTNAWTTERATGYWLKSSPKDLPQTLATLARVAAPIALDTQFALEERDIILREYDYRVAEDPFFDLDQQMNRVLYQNGPLSRSVIGTPQDIASFDLDQARALHRQSHDLRTASLIVYGNVSARQLRQALAQLDPPTMNPAAPVDLPLLLPALQVARDQDSVRLDGIGDTYLIYRKLIERPDCGTPVQCDSLIYLTQVFLDSIQPGGLAGPLRFDNFIARSFTITITPLGMDRIELWFSATPDRGVSLDQLQQAFEQTLEKSLSGGIPEKTFANIVQQDKNDLASLSNPAERTIDLLLNGVSNDTGIYGYRDEQNVHATLTRQDMNTFLKALNQPGRVVIRHVQPKKDDT